ncbi:MAG: adenine deaminase [Oscillospiraceae bacterium]
MDCSPEIKMVRARKMVDTLLRPGEYADLVLQGGQFINVLTREIYPADVAVQGGLILMTGDCSALIGENTQVLNVAGKYVCPGFIDSHMHFESSMLTATEFSRLSIPSGTTALFPDPHEIGNVLGIEGIEAMLQEAENLPNHIYYAVPALTPDVPGLETAGGLINSGNIRRLLASPLVQGLGEMQGFSNVHPVYRHSPALIDDLLASVYYAKQAGKTVEGNAPELFGPELAAHIVVCGGETSCHETTTKAECAEKLRSGVTVFMREGSTQRNMAECIRVVTEDGMDSRKLVLATDDMVAEDLLKTGHMNDVLRRTIAEGVDPVEAIQMATINAAWHFGRKDIGVLAPGKAADICVISNLAEVTVDLVVLGGKIAAENGRLLLDIPRYTYPAHTKNSVHHARIKPQQLTLSSSLAQQEVRAIGIVPDQNLTTCVQAVLPVENGVVMPGPGQDIAAFVSIERHGKHGGIGKTFVQGLGIQRGAIAQSIAHDTHNLLVCGVNFDDMAMAANRVIAMGGGIAMVKDGKVVADLPLPIAGLMTNELAGKELGKKLEELHSLAAAELGVALHAPFMHLSFLSLVTSPKWKLSDKGLVDAESYTIISTLAGQKGAPHEL